MAEKILNTRILLKYDTLENWNATTTYLRKGEVAIATVASGTGEEVGSVATPQVLVKVGDGKTLFKDLPFITAKAGDVYSWAKEPTLLYKDLPTTLIDEIDALQAAVGTNGSVAQQIADAIKEAVEGLDVTDAEVANEVVVAVPQADGKVAPVRRKLVAADIPELAQEKITGLTGALSDLNTAITNETSARETAVQEAKNYADQKVTALADGAVADNTAAIAAINNETTGILAQAKADATQKANDAEAAAKAHAEQKATAAETAAKDYVDQKVQEINGAASTLESRVKAIEDDYLVEADKTELANATNTVATNLANEITRATDAETALDARLDKVETFFELEEGKTLDAALDTLIEIQEYLTGEGEAADQLLERVAQAEEDIDAIEADYLKKADKDELAGDIADEVTRAKAAEEANTAAIGVINSNIGTVPTGKTLIGLIGENTTAINTEKSRAEAAEASLLAKIGTVAEGQNLAALITANTNAINDEAATRSAADTKHTNDIKAINDKLGEGTLTAGTTLVAAINANTAAIAAEKTRAEAAEAQVLTDAKAYTDALRDGQVKTNTDAISAINGKLITTVEGDDVVKAKLEGQKITIDFDDTLTFILKAGDSTNLDATAQG